MPFLEKSYMKIRNSNYKFKIAGFLFAVLSLYLATASLSSAFFVETRNINKAGALKTIVIDPGHGGEDTGAIGPSGIKEKDINLQIAKKLEKLILRKMGGRVILTRRDDTFIPLEQRTAIANKNKADLFISIHTNAAYRKGASGVETYFLSFGASDEDAKRAADFENTAISSGGKKNGKGADDLKTILMDMAQTEFLNESGQLAEMLQENLCRTLKVENRGIKQAPFIVLAGAAMPAVLIEVGFISNARDEKKLTLPQTHDAIAGAIYKSLVRFDGMLKAKMGYAYDKGGM